MTRNLFATACAWTGDGQIPARTEKRLIGIQRQGFFHDLISKIATRFISPISSINRYQI